MSRAAPARRVLVVSFSDLHSDPRVSRQIGLLSRSFAVTAAGHADPRVPGVSFVPLAAAHWSAAGKIAAAARLKAGAFERVYWSSRCVRDALAGLAGERFDLVVANDIWTLPLALALRGGGKVLFDAHEYAPLEFEESRRWRFFFRAYNEYLCERYVPLADGACTVCDGIAREFRRTTGVAMGVVHNCPPYEDLRPAPLDAAGPLRLVHHGGAIPSRRLETMVEAMRHLGAEHTLDFVLVPSVPRYLERLVRLAAGDARIRFLPPVPMRELPRFLNAYDVGVYLLPPNNFNNRNALPNKFFEFVQARLALAIGPSPEMAALLARHDLGVVSEDFSPASFARALARFERGRIARCKANADAAARELSFERAAETFMQIVERLLAVPCAA
ncbi:MAG: hypothetical protein IT529_03110 [Burkholderiales bacterium]|nr:hypothetical protein [Burkholderiales bacterium]